MAQKKATVYVLNVSHSMKDDFETARDTLLDSLEFKVLSGRKTDLVSVLLVGTEDTNNMLAEQTPEQYEHIITLCPISQPNLELLRTIKSLKVSNPETPSGDVLDAVIVANQMIIEHCKKLKYSKSIVTLTNTCNPIDWLDLEAVGDMLIEAEVKLTLIIPRPEESRSDETMRMNLEHWEILSIRTKEGSVISLEEAYEATQEDFVKEIRPTPSYRGYLYLGHPMENEHFIGLHIFMYPRVREAKLPSGQKWSNLSEGPTHAVIQESKFIVEQGEEEKEVSKDELEKGYRFGKTIVKLTEEEMLDKKLKTRKEMSIIGFLLQDAVPRHYLFSNANIITAGNYNTEESAKGLRALAYGLFEKKVVALVRYVPKEDGAVKIGILQPELILGDDKPDTFLLHYFDIPFAEDVRQYRFPSFQGQHDQKGVDMMDRLIDAMNLDQLGKDYLVPETNFNPFLWRIQQAIKTRALDPSASIPHMKKVYKAQFEVADALKKSVGDLGQQIADHYQVKPVQERVAKRSFDEMEEIITTANPADVQKILKERPTEPVMEERMDRVEYVGITNPVEDFVWLLKNPSSDESLEMACKQLGEVTIQLLDMSFGSQNYEKAIQCLKEFRAVGIKKEAATIYNEHIRKIKAWCNLNASFSPRHQFWNMLKANKLGLISNEECEAVDVIHITKELAEQFWNKEEQIKPSEIQRVDDDSYEFDIDNLDDLL